MKLYPRSFLQLILTGYVLALAPLLAAIVYVLFSLDTLSDQYQEAIIRSAEGGRLRSELPDELEHMEEGLKRYELTPVPAALKDYVDARNMWQRDGAEYLKVAGGSPELAARFQAMLAREKAAYAQLAESGSTQALRETVEALQTEVRQLVDQGNGIIQARSDQFRREELSLRIRLWVALALAVILAGVVLVGGRRMLGVLLDRFEREVVRLGKGQLDKPIQLQGPEDMRWLGKRLDWLRRRLLLLESARIQLLRHVSHELKTPLAALREGASLLTEGAAGALTESQSRIADIMQNNAVRLDALIDGLLKLQRADHASERIRFVPVRLDALVQQVLATHQLATRDKHLNISGSLAPVTIEGGEEELLTVVHNLVSNAIKYSPDGGRIRVDLFESGSYAVLDVVDEGPGVAKEDADRIFEPFYRSARTGQVAGVGLGLAIARQYVHAHRGHLRLIDSPKGADFRATFPLAPKAS